MQNALTAHQQSMPSLPASLTAFVKTNYRNFTDCPGYWDAPKQVPIETSRAAAVYVTEVRKSFPPVRADVLASRIATLLSHYFTATQDAKINAMIAADWRESVGMFPQECLENAVRWWRDNEARKPKPSDIRKLAIRNFGEDAWEKYERSVLVSQLPCYDDSRVQDQAQPEEWKKPTDEGRARVALTLHNAGIAHDKQFCAACNGAT